MKQTLARLMRDPFYRTYRVLFYSLRSRKRYVPCSVRVNGWMLDVPDTASFLSGYRGIFVDKTYFFKTDTERPRIVDLGANIGLSILYFKSLYPKAEVCAFEADPGVFQYLLRNVHGNGFQDVTLINKAAWHEKATLCFLSEGSDAGRVASSLDKTGSIEVEAVDVFEVIAKGRVDFLKIDIEGAEVAVLGRCRLALAGVQRIFVEYHSRSSEQQKLAFLLEILESQGFRYQIRSTWGSPHPFSERQLVAGYDMMLNIYAWREGSC
ncbi:MAG: FkbM family methyltransferase [Candidatus Omnitrophica bacterium]|nr:FkbM family methyltransferase [Candidatus Omnitrophota bacterium]